MSRWLEAIDEDVGRRVLLKGDWRISDFPEILAELAASGVKEAQRVVIDGSGLVAIDTACAGALLTACPSQRKSVSFENLSDGARRVIELVSGALQHEEPEVRARRISPIEGLGKAGCDVLRLVKGLITALGESLIGLTETCVLRRKLRLRELTAQLELTAFRSLPVVILVLFLIGVVVAYLSATEMEKYGASMFIVDGVALAVGRELSPLLVAVVMAGRSGSAFTAQIGSMKINEEIDALRVLGLSPLEILVLPRVLALALAMPLLVFVGDVVGIYGGMLIADLRLDIEYFTFLDRLRSTPLKHFVLGFIKAPFFALAIAIIGCRMGLNVEKNARSLGLHTTSTVVQSIVTVILLDAAFAVLFIELGY